MPQNKIGTLISNHYTALAATVGVTVHSRDAAVLQFVTTPLESTIYFDMKCTYR